MATHPSGVTVEILGIECRSQGRSCDEHEVCGSVLVEDAVVRFRKVQVVSQQGQEEAAIAVYWVSDGIDRCRVGFLQRHLVMHWKQYEGVLAQVTEVYAMDSESPFKRKKFHHNKGMCVAAIISSLPDDSNTQMSNHKRTSEDAASDNDNNNNNSADAPDEENSHQAKRQNTTIFIISMKSTKK